MRKRKIALRVLFCVFLSAIAQVSAIIIGASIHGLQWLIVFESPGVYLGVLIDKLLPKKPCTEAFCGLGQTFLLVGLTDWFFWAAIIFTVHTLDLKRQAAKLPPREDPS